MTEVRPFRGIRYNSSRFGLDLSDLLCPPYDVIAPADHVTLLDRDPWNFVRLELPRHEPGDAADADRYRRAAEMYRRWLADGIFQREGRPAFYAYRQRFSLDGRERERRGIVGALRIEPWERRIVRPHERTLVGPKRDRLELMRACNANFSPIWGLYEDRTGAGVRLWGGLAGREPTLEATDAEGVRHQVWVVAEPDLLEGVRTALAGAHCYIADGHHRYETALHYEATRCADGGCSDDSAIHFTMAYLVEVSDPGLVVFGTHRMVRSSQPPAAEDIVRTLSQSFDLIEVPGRPISALLADLELERAGPAFALWAPRLGIAIVARLKEREVPEDLAPGHSAAWRRLDLAALHLLAIDRIYPEGTTQLSESGSLMYSRSLAEVERALGAGEAQVVFLVRSTSIEQVMAVADAGDLMPEKSTYFYPKPLSGAVVASLEGEVPRLA